MIAVLRFLGVLNGAVWLGGSVFYTLGIYPGLRNAEMMRIFKDFYTGVITQLSMDRYYTLSICCAIIALVHLVLAEWLYLGKALQRLTLCLILGVFCITLIGKVWLQPKLKELHHITYLQNPNTTEAGRNQAKRSFRLWNGLSRTVNLLILPVLILYTWRVVTPPTGTRFVTTSKFRS